MKTTNSLVVLYASLLSFTKYHDVSSQTSTDKNTDIKTLDEHSFYEKTLNTSKSNLLTGAENSQSTIL